MKPYALFAVLMFLSAVPAHAEITYTLDEDYGDVPVTFVPNVGQFDSTVSFAAEGNDGNGLGGDTGVVFQLEDSDTITTIAENTWDEKLFLQFVNSNNHPTVTYEDPATWNSNYFIGSDPDNWHTDIPNYRSARLHDIYPGIDMIVRGDGRDIQYLLTVTPGADPSQIRFLDYDEDIIGGNTSLVGRKGWQDLADRIYEPAPDAFQVIDGEEVPVGLRYGFIDTGYWDSADSLYFVPSPYDHDHELYIKLDMFASPVMMLKHSGVSDIAVDDEDCVYVAGGATYKKNRFDFRTLFAMKLNEAGDGLEYVTYFGNKVNNVVQYVNSIAVNNKTEVVIGGYFNGDFPYTENAYDTEKTSDYESYILKLNTEGNRLLYSTYLGGSDGDTIFDVSIDELGYVFIAGKTISDDFPVTDGVFDNTFNYNNNGFIAILSPDGAELVESTYIEMGWCKEIKYYDSEILFTGEGSGVIFIGKMKSDLSDTVYTVNLYGSSHDYITGMDLDFDGNIFVAGYTESEDFYTTDGSTYNGGRRDCFAAKIDNNGTLLWSKLFGGSGDDGVYGGVCVDSYGNASVTGWTQSSDYPTTPGAYHENIYAGNDAFLTTIDSFGQNILYSTYIGYSNLDEGYGLSKDFDSNLYLFGYSRGITQEPNSIFNENESFLIKFKLDDPTAIHEDINQNQSFIIHPPYPNPFNPIVNISYYLPQAENVALNIYNLHGQLVQTLVNEYQQVGSHTVIWNSGKCATGVYLYQISVDNTMKTGKLLLIK